MTADEIAAIRARVDELLADFSMSTRDDLALIALRLCAHLEHANTQADRARDLVAAVELKANTGTLDELLVAALAHYRRQP